MKVALAQVQFALGDFDGNCRQILQLLKKSHFTADLLVFPEGGVWGYPPKDFLFCNQYFKIQEAKLKLIKNHLPKNLKVLLPAFIKNRKKIQNVAFLFEKKRFLLKSFFLIRECFLNPVILAQERRIRTFFT